MLLVACGMEKKATEVIPPIEVDETDIEATVPEGASDDEETLISETETDMEASNIKASQTKK